jgi:DNA polymerase III delta prime subunit
MLAYPPPHYILFEPLNDIETQKVWTEYKKIHGDTCEYAEVDAAEINSVETFAPWFYNWISQVPAKQSQRIRILIVYHSEFLTFSCQQMIRRSLEERSFKCRVWFHVEDPTTIQPAIQSRCIVKRMPTYTHEPVIKQYED